MKKMNDEKGLTLMELILALAMTGVVLLAVNSLNLATISSSVDASSDVKIMEEINYVFRDMEIYLRDSVSSKDLTHKPGTTNLTCTGEDGNPKSDTKSPCFYRDNSNVWLGVWRPDPDPAAPAGAYQEVWYGFAKTVDTGDLTRKIWKSTTSDWDPKDGTTLSENILAPYTLCGKYTPMENSGQCDEQTTRSIDGCLLNLAKIDCEDKDIWPVFQIMGQNIFISFRGYKSNKTIYTSGMTKAIFIHASET